MALLEVKNLGISFGGLRAVDGFNITIEKGQLYGLIGPNGAGKTTCFSIHQPMELLHWTEKTLLAKRRWRSIKRELPERSRISGFSKNSLFWIMSK